jgi:hypothetical protein
MRVSRRPVLLRSASMRRGGPPGSPWQISQRPARSRWISSLHRPLAMTCPWSVRMAVHSLERDPAEVLRDNGEIVVVKQRAALRWPSLAHVERALLPDDGPGLEQPDCSVDRPATPGDL